MSGATGNEAALVTTETVAAAADALAARGERPSVRSVIKMLGGGSPNAVLLALRTWKEASLSATAEAPDTAPKPSADIPMKLDALPEVGPAMDSLMQAILGAVGRIQSAERKSAEDRLAAALATHGEELAARDRQHEAALTALRDDLEDMKAALDEALPFKAEAEDLRGQLNATEAAKQHLSTEKKDLEDVLTAVRRDLEGMEKARDTALEASKKATDDAAAWRDQLTRAQGDLAAARDQATADLATMKKEADEQLAALRAELAAATTATIEATTKSRMQADRITELIGEVKQAHGERDAANGKLEAVLEQRALKAETALAAATPTERQ